MRVCAVTALNPPVPDGAGRLPRIAHRASRQEGPSPLRERTLGRGGFESSSVAPSARHRVTGQRAGSGWPTTVKAAPFGDLSGDRCDDVLVRFSSGALRAYRPACGAAVTPSTAYTSLGTGWNQYNVLTSPGDISGDGRADIVSRDTSGTVWRNNGNGR